MTGPAGAAGEFLTRREAELLVTARQRETERLENDIRTLKARLDSLDEHGTRGIGVVQMQITDLAKDVAKLEEKMEKHDADHEQDARARAAGRRWWVTAAIAFVAAVDGPIVTLLLARGH